MTIVDLCAGPGGWDIAADVLGLHPIGIEIDADACATRAANGLATIRADMTQLDPTRFGILAGLIASPPCPQFSAAGKGYGRLLIAEICAAIDDALQGLPIEPHRQKMADMLQGHLIAEALDAGDIIEAGSLDGDRDVAERFAMEAALTAEPARWIHACLPEWVAFEQVPAVLPIWQHIAHRLRGAGYSVWCGHMQAEQYGVPQTRRRAVLIASRVRTVTAPVATHQLYVHGEAQGAGEDCQPSLFGPGVLPWVSMADALGWNEGTQLGFARLDDTGTSADGYRERDWRDSDEPSFAVTEKARSWVARRPRGAGMLERHGERSDRAMDEPAPTVLANGGGNASPGFQFVNTGQNSRQAGGETVRFERETDAPAPTVTSQARSWVLTDRRPNGAERSADEPAPTITSSLDNGDKAWVHARLATTIACDSRVFQPGGHHTTGAQSENAIRLAPAEAACLQSFPPHHEFAGTKTSVFRQIGNAVPPLLALPVVAEAAGIPTGAPT